MDKDGINFYEIIQTKRTVGEGVVSMLHRQAELFLEMINSQVGVLNVYCIFAKRRRNFFFNHALLKVDKQIATINSTLRGNKSQTALN